MAIQRTMADTGGPGGWPPLKEEISDVNGNNNFTMADGFGINELGGLDGNPCHDCFRTYIGYGLMGAMGCLFTSRLFSLEMFTIRPFVLDPSSALMELCTIGVTR